MLKAHLNPDTDAASRKPETIDKTVNWIMRQHPTAQTLLGLGCGPGLYTKRFYEEGLEVTGIDMSEISITYAQKQEASIDYRVGNYVDMNFQDEFDIITLIYYDFGVLKPEDRRRLLEAVKRALRPGGIFVFDVLHVNSLKDFEQEKREIDMGNFFTTKPHTLTLASIYYPDTKNTLDHYIVQTEDENREYFIWNQLYTKEDVEKELEAAGFEIEIYNDLTGTPYDGEGEGMGLVARPSKGDRSH